MEGLTYYPFTFSFIFYITYQSRVILGFLKKNKIDSWLENKNGDKTCINHNSTDKNNEIFNSDVMTGVRTLTPIFVYIFDYYSHFVNLPKKNIKKYLNLIKHNFIKKSK